MSAGRPRASRRSAALRRWLPGILLLGLAAVAAPVRAEEPAIWSLEGRGGDVLLLGSVHLLRQEDYPLPANVMAAYASADRLVMELDENDLDPLAVQMLLLETGRLPAGRTLADVMEAADYRRAQKHAQELGFPLELIETLKPWLAAITIMNLQSMGMGFRPELGLEQHLAGLARRDGKPVEGLETVEFQLALFDGLPESTQAKLLLQTLAEAALMEEQLTMLIDAWRRGDSAALDRELTRSFADYPEVYRRLVTDRNRTWSRHLARLADERGTTLVVVGALHLVGENSVVEMLEGRGRKIRRWQGED